MPCENWNIPLCEPAYMRIFVKVIKNVPLHDRCEGGLVNIGVCWDSTEKTRGEK